MTARSIFMFYEGVHLSPRVQARLYDRWSKKYGEGKRASQLRAAEMLAHPLMDFLKDTPEPFVLDFATGTGRLAHALLSQPDSNGHIIALDLSQWMLEQVATKLRGQGLDTSGENVEFLRHQTLPLSFPDSAFDFDAVGCLEGLELLPTMTDPRAQTGRCSAQHTRHGRNQGARRR